MNVDLPTLQAFFASAPFMADLGVVLIGIAVMIFGALLPATREGTASATIDAPAATANKRIFMITPPNRMRQLLEPA